MNGRYLVDSVRITPSILATPEPEYLSLTSRHISSENTDAFTAPFIAGPPEYQPKYNLEYPS